MIYFELKLSNKYKLYDNKDMLRTIEYKYHL